MKCPNCNKEINRVNKKETVIKSTNVVYSEEYDQLGWSSLYEDNEKPVKSELNGYYCPECDCKIMDIKPRKLQIMFRGGTLKELERSI